MEEKIKEYIYLYVKYLTRICITFFYRGVEQVGKENVPSEGPFIYAVNHQNAFLDAVLVGALSPVPTYFMTRSDVFKPPFGWILSALKMMPIYRIRDGYKTLNKNNAIFETCKELLEKKQAILIFPEGNHGLEYYLRPLTKGISRIALQSQAEMEFPIKIVPVGLNYFNHFHAGHKFIINYGTPIEVSDFLSTYTAHSHKGLLQLTRKIFPEMQETLIIPAESDTYFSEKGVFQRKNESRSFNELRKLRYDSSSVAPEKKYPLLAYLGELFGIFNLPPILLTKYILHKKVSQKIFHVSIKFASLLIVFPIWFLLSFLVVTLIYRWETALIFLSIQVITLLIRRELVRYNH